MFFEFKLRIISNVFLKNFWKQEARMSLENVGAVIEQLQSITVYDQVRHSNFKEFATEIKSIAQNNGVLVAKNGKFFTKSQMLKHFKEFYPKNRRGEFYCVQKKKVGCKFCIRYSYNLDKRVYEVYRVVESHNHEANLGSFETSKQGKLIIDKNIQLTEEEKAFLKVHALNSTDVKVVRSELESKFPRKQFTSRFVSRCLLSFRKAEEKEKLKKESCEEVLVPIEEPIIPNCVGERINIINNLTQELLSLSQINNHNWLVAYKGLTRAIEKSNSKVKEPNLDFLDWPSKKPKIS